MDPVSAGVGLVASIISIVEAAKSIHGAIKRLRTAGHRRTQLLTPVNHLILTLQSAELVSDAAAAYTLSSLQELRSVLESLERAPVLRYPSLARSLCRCVVGQDGLVKLEEVEQKLENLRTEVVVIEGMLQLQNRISYMCNEKVELPLSHVGLDRSKVMSEFLEKSHLQDFRVIGIHGQPGIGKTTLLNYIWQEDSLRCPFVTRAYVQVGHDATPESICKLQSSMLQQLGGGSMEFPCEIRGKKRLSDHFQKLRISNKPMFLAIDNVFDPEDLQKLLPFKLSKECLPASSCIALTCRDYRVVKALLNICHLQEKNQSQVFCLTPSCLDIEDSKVVFAECADMQATDHVELLDSLVPLCGGLPLALTVLGKLFVDERKREKMEWESIKKQMEVLKGDDQEISPMIKSLQLSFDKLKETQKAAFVDVVNFFYGWRWETVERIVGANVLQDLKNSSLISEADNWTKCNQSALRVGFLCDEDAYLLQCKPSARRVVTMHDLTLKFGQSLQVQSKDFIKDFANEGGLENYHNLDAGNFKNLMLLTPKNALMGSQLEFLKRATNLQMLIMVQEQSAPKLLKASGKNLLHGSSNNFHPSLTLPKERQLHYLRLHRWRSSKLILETLQLHEVREIHLENCADIKELPDAPLRCLERLTISKCRNFLGFSSSCVGEWCNLKDLEVISCNKITQVPSELGSLQSLQSVAFRDCRSLKDFTSLCNSNGPQYLLLEDCCSLESVPVMSCPLLRVELHSVPITNLLVSGDACVFLEVLSLSGCRFEVLPSFVCNVSSLQTLGLSSCHQLKELPEDIGKLEHLRVLSLVDCGAIKKLPRGIGDILFLQELEVKCCENLVELPDEVGRLTSLTKLDVSGCKKLKKLTPAIGDALCLRQLILRDCENLLELPDEIGRLSSLTVLDASNCKRLKGLPSGIGDASSLETLILHSCEDLVELPNELGQLTLLTNLDVHGCKKLNFLPCLAPCASTQMILR